MAKFWLRVLTEIKNRGTSDVCIVVCDGLKGLPEAINTVWPHAVVQTCVIHLLRNTFRYASRKYWDQIAKDIRPIYTAADRSGGQGTLRRVHREVGRPVPGDHPAVGERLERVRPVPGLRRRDPPRHLLDECRESLNARYRRAIRARGHFPTEQAALKCLYLVTRSLDPTGRGKARWAMRWKPALNAFAITLTAGSPRPATKPMPRSDPPLIGQPPAFCFCGRAGLVFGVAKDRWWRFVELWWRLGYRCRDVGRGVLAVVAGLTDPLGR